MKLSKLLFPIALLVIFVSTTGRVMAQEEARAEVTTLYNSAQELAQSANYDRAIELFEQTLEQADAAGLQDIRQLVVGQLPRVYSARAATAYRAFQSTKSVANVDAAIAAFQDALAAGETYGDANAAAQAANAIPQLIYAKSIVQFSAGDLQASSATLDEALAANPNYAQAMYQKGIVSRRLEEDVNTTVGYFEQAIALADATGRGNIAGNARTQAVETLLFAAVPLAEERQFQASIALLERAVALGTNSADVHYRMAEVQNKRSEYRSAIEHAELALEYESGGVVDKAKIYFELGLAHQMLNQRDEACAALKNAAYGDFRDPAQYKMEFELKCPGVGGN